jgi:UDP-3-O-[3-hydroxymyristoyl] glucosamine N-acyltransferase
MINELKMHKLENLIKILSPVKVHINTLGVHIESVIKSNVQNESDSAVFWVSPKFNTSLVDYNHGTILCNILPDNHLSTKCNYLVFENPRQAFQILLKSFFCKTVEYTVSQTAIIDESVKLSENIKIGENVVIEKDCSIGENVIIGHNTVIHSNTKISNNTIIGCNCTVGGVGFGYEKDKNGAFQVLQHIGGVYIGNNVEIGNNTCIDKAVLGDTIIGRGTKIDNLVHIAHNCEIGENTLITAGVTISGSVVIGANNWISPNSTIIDGVSTGENVKVGIGAVVIRNIPSDKTVFGNPAKIIS